MLVGRWMVVLRRGAVIASALLALLAAAAAARLEVSGPLTASFRAMSPSPDPFDFGAWPVHHFSSTQTFTFTYTGSNSDGTVIQGNPSVSGGDPSSFTVLAPRTDSGDCEDGLRVGFNSSCTVLVEFAATSAGAKSTHLHVMDDDGCGCGPTDNSALLSGTGALPTRSPTSLAFGNQGVGTTSAAKTVTVTNNSKGNFLKLDASTSGDFSKGSNCPASGTLTPSQSCSIFVKFAPTAPGARSGTLTISTDSGNVTVALSGNGTVHLAHTPNALAFGNQRTGTQSGTQNVVFTNDSGGPVTPGAATVTGADAGQFAMSNGCTIQIAPGAKCTIGMRFKPTAIGARSASLNLASNSTSSPDVIPLSGNGTVHLADAPASLAFGNQLLNTQSAVQNVTFTNDSGAPVTPGAATMTGADAGQFAIASNGCTSAVAAGANCVIGLRFQPTASGPRSAALNLASNSTASPDVIALSGTGTTPVGAASTAAPGIGFDVSTLDFGARIVNGGELKQRLTLTNTGAQPLIIATITITGPNAADFSLATLARALVGCAAATLAPGESCSVDINFLPSAAGDRTASLLIADNAPGSPHSLALQGSGLPPPVLYTTANAEPVSGDVTVALPPTAGARASILKGRRFIPLKEARQVPIGTIFDTKKGRVRIATATTKRGKTQAGQFFAGLFQVLQRRSEKSLTEAKLVGSNFKTCAAPTGKTSARIAKKKKINKDVIRTLRANVKGKFRTRGRFAAATVRGTIWSMQDRCDGTLTRVTRGTVVVRDLRAQRNIVVRTGKSAFVPKR